MASESGCAGKIRHRVELLAPTSEERKDRRKFLKRNKFTDCQDDLKCTKCKTSFVSLVEAGDTISSHPLLGVLFCKTCTGFYASGEFSVDSDGDEKYCRWCGEGGSLFECSKCIWLFCKKCIKKNLGSEQLAAVVADDDWQCLVCEPKPLWPLRHLAQLAEEEAHINRAKKKEERQTRLMELKNKVTVRKQRIKKVIQLDSSSTDKESKSKRNGSVSPKLDSFTPLTDLMVCLKESGDKSTIEETLKKFSEIGQEIQKQADNFLRALSKQTSKKDLKALSSDVENVIRKTIDPKLKGPSPSKKTPVKREDNETDSTVSSKGNREVAEIDEDELDAYNAETEVEDGNNSVASPTKVSETTEKKKTQEETPKKNKMDALKNTVLSSSDVTTSSESSGSSPKKLLSRKQRTERRNKRLSRRNASEKTESDVIDSLTNLRTLRSRRKIIQSDSDKSTDKEPSPAKKTKTERLKPENKETLLDMINGVSSDSGEDVDDSLKSSNDNYVASAKLLLKDLVLNTSSDEKEPTDDESGDETLIKKRKRQRASSSSDEEFRQFKKKVLDSDSGLSDSSPRSPAKKKTDSDSENNVDMKKSTRKGIIFDSDSQSSDSLPQTKKSNGKQAASDSSFSKTSETSKKTSSDSNKKKQKKKKLKRILGNDSKSDSSSSSVSVEFVSQTSDKGKKGRKNIKKLMKSDALQEETLDAAKHEKKRKKRLAEREKKFQELFGHNQDPKKLILDFDDDGEILLEVSPRLVKKLKPHQRDGVKFMWDNCFESLKEMETSNGGGCILAHCMGLGKTMQVVTLLHTVLSNDIGANTALIVCPLNTVANWEHECEMWLEVARCDTIDIYNLHKHKQLQERRHILNAWQRNGGILIISYDMYRNLTKKKKNPSDEPLVRPGPDIIICDEGHLLKNEDSARSRCLSLVQTLRRIVLTGTPLQNNLREYHCMVQFIKPNILGTKQEFANRFVNPIVNGQFEDSTPIDVSIMKRRSHVLYTMLSGCIQRRDYSVLTPFLPVKHEFVISLALSEPLAKAYRHYLENLSAKANGTKTTMSLFQDFHSLQQIWTHPLAIQWQQNRVNERRREREENEEETMNFVDDRSEGEMTECGSSSDSVMCLDQPAPKKHLRSNPLPLQEEENPIKKKEWWDEFLSEEMFDLESASTKLVVLFAILSESEKQGDKVLVFSQSLTALDLIEHFLERRAKMGEDWIEGRNYFRLDGRCPSEKRAKWCQAFNRETNKAAKLFLISTKAGGLGINLVGANRVVIFDASWNPSHDLQSIFRIYRFGQKKQCYVYRLLAEATMEEKIYERQVTKLSLAGRVVDEHQIERHYTMGNLQELYRFEPTPRENWKSPILPKDDVLAKILKEHADIIVKYHEHDSLLENKQEEELTEEERKAAWEEYEFSQKPQQQAPTMGFNQFQQQLQAHYQNMMGQEVPGPGTIQSYAQPFVNRIHEMMETGQRFPNPFALRQPPPPPPPQIPSFLNHIDIQNVPDSVLPSIAQSMGMLPVANETIGQFRNRIEGQVAYLRRSQH